MNQIRDYISGGGWKWELAGTRMTNEVEVRQPSNQHAHPFIVLRIGEEVEMRSVKGGKAIFPADATLEGPGMPDYLQGKRLGDLVPVENQFYEFDLDKGFSLISE